MIQNRVMVYYDVFLFAQYQGEGLVCGQVLRSGRTRGYRTFRPGGKHLLGTCSGWVDGEQLLRVGPDSSHRSKLLSSHDVVAKASVQHQDRRGKI